MNCQNCHIKNQIIESQQKEIARLQRIIQQAQAATAKIEAEADQVMSSNQPRGVWAFNKGKKETTSRISPMLYY